MIVTMLYAGILALWFLALSYHVVRGRSKVSLGDGGDPELLRRIRGHGNFAEYTPYILLMIGMLELARLPLWAIHALGITLVAARLLHGIALSFTGGWKFGRFWGAALSFLLLLVCGGLCLWRGLMALPAQM